MRTKIALFVALTAFACKPRNDDAGSAVKADGDAAPGVGGFDVNDVSFLFAKTGDGTFYPSVDVTTVWPKTAFDDLISFGKNKSLNGIQFGQFILPADWAKLVDTYTATPTAAANDAKSKAAKAIAAEMQRNQTQCQLYKGGPAKICIDSSAQLNFGNHRDAILDQTNWRIVSARMDLCAGAHNDKAAQCDVEFRLIAQPWGDFAPQPPVNGQVPPLTTQPGQRGPHLFDVTAHLLYKIGTLELATGKIKDESGKVVANADAIVKDLQALKAASTVSTNGKPLGVHPGFKAEAGAGSGPFGTAMLNLIRKYTGGGSKMTQVTSMHLAGATVFDSSVWVFYQGLVKGGRWSPIPITGSQVIWSIRTASVKGAGGKMFPPPELQNKRVSIDPIFDFGDPNQPQSLPANVVDLPAFFDNPGRYGDPKLLVAKNVAASVRNTDCISCHMTETRAYEWGISGVGPSTYQPPVGTTAYLDPEVVPRVDYNLRNFGYFLPPPLVTPLTGNEVGLGIFNFVGTRVEQPAVMTRVVHESAELAHMINSLYLKQPNPGLVCANEDVEGAFSASANSGTRFATASQQIIRRTAKAHAAVHDCLLYQSFKQGGSFAACAQICQTGGSQAGGAATITFPGDFSQPRVAGQLALGQPVTILYDKARLTKAFPNCLTGGKFSERLVPTWQMDGGAVNKLTGQKGTTVDVTKGGATYASITIVLPASGADLALWFGADKISNKSNCGFDSNSGSNYHFPIN